MVIIMIIIVLMMMMMMTMTMIDGGDVSIFVARNNSSSDVLTVFQTDMSLVS